jgi:hypothetical protein
MITNLLNNIFTSHKLSYHERYLLCIPRGGLNDTLVQIYKCLEYSERFNRTLIIDTKKSGIFRDFDDFFEFIDIDTHYIGKTDESLYQRLNTYNCYPRYCRKNLNKYISAHNKKLRSYTIRGGRRKLQFKQKKNYRHQLLVHENCGGGVESLELLKRLKLTDGLAKLVREKIDSFGGDYVAIHIRNTDYQSHYKEFFKSLYSSMKNQRVLVCSDNGLVVDEAKIFFDQSEILTTNVPYLENNKCLHVANNYVDEDAKFDAPNNAIIDLLALANAENVYYPKVFKDSSKTLTSGFSQLAHNLSKNKFLVKQLIGESIQAPVTDA